MPGLLILGAGQGQVGRRHMHRGALPLGAVVPALGAGGALLPGTLGTDRLTLLLLRGGSHDDLIAGLQLGALRLGGLFLLLHHRRRGGRRLGLLLFDRGGLIKDADLELVLHGLGLAALFRHLIADAHLGGVAAKAQKTGLGPLDDFHGHIVPVQSQLKQGGGDRVLLRAAGGFDPLYHTQTPSFSSLSGSSTSSCSTSTSTSSVWTGWAGAADAVFSFSAGSSSETAC